MSGDYEFQRVMDHINVYLSGVFQFSADNMQEANNIIRESEEKTNDKGGYH